MIIIYCFIIRNLLWNSFIMHQLIIVIIIKYIESRLYRGFYRRVGSGIMKIKKSNFSAKWKIFCQTAKLSKIFW